MKRAFFAFLILVAACITLACMPQSDISIVGTWKFDHSSVKKGVTLNAEEKGYFESNDADLKASKLALKFEANNKFSDTEYGYTDSGTYKVTSDKKKLVLSISGETVAADILELTAHDLALLYNYDGVDFIVYHFKR